VRATQADPPARALDESHAVGRDLEGLGDALHHQLAVAARRLEDLRERRRRLQRDLDAAFAAEEEGRQALAALRSLVARAGGVVISLEAAPTADRCAHVLAGGDLRDAIARVALRRNAHGQAVHWRTWYEWLRNAGFDAAGKRSEATFQTQLARSPLVQRTERDGVYVLDVELVRKRRDELLELHDRLAQLPPADQLALMGDVRSERRALQQRIGRAERALEEAWRLLVDELDGEWTGSGMRDAEQIIDLWQRRIAP
jgi:hypothetical protein